MSQPLLSSSRPSSEDLDDQAVAEEDALLAGQTGRPAPERRYGWKFWREVGLFAWAFLATVAVIVIAVLYQHQGRAHDGTDDGSNVRRPSGKRNLIFMVSDGMGPTSLSLTRSFKQFEAGSGPGDVLVLDRHHIGSSRTRSTSSLITDSAAGATAFSCGLKSYNGAISVLPDHSPCGTVMEAAKLAGYMTGLVVTTRITDATPACFAAHVHLRGQEDAIAEQEVGEHPLGRVVDLILGGGRCHFLPNTTDGSCREDDKDVVALARANGFSYIDDRASFDRLQRGEAAELPLLGLLAEKDIPYEVDRRFVEDAYPSLDEMARTALAVLEKATEDRDKGFFLMIEGSRIDHAGHANDPVAQVHEVLAYDQAMASVARFLEHSDVDGVMVSTSDHETGGLATARREWHISVPGFGAIHRLTSRTRRIASVVSGVSLVSVRAGQRDPLGRVPLGSSRRIPGRALERERFRAERLHRRGSAQGWPWCGGRLRRRSAASDRSSGADGLHLCRHGQSTSAGRMDHARSLG